jgi:hypothetical protein
MSGKQNDTSLQQQQRQQQQPISLPVVEKQSINSISFVPGYHLRVKLYSCSKNVINDPKLRSKLPSMQHDFPPENSVLVRTARNNKTSATNIVIRNYTESTATQPAAAATTPATPATPPTAAPCSFDILKTRKPILLGGSNGLNGILSKFNAPLLRHRVNLFHLNDATTLHLLNEFIDFRNANISQMFVLTVLKMEEDCNTNNIVKYLQKFCVPPPPQQDGEDGAYKQLLNDYHIVIELYKQLLANQNAFHRTMGTVSFCQTWATSSSNDDDDTSPNSPQFSVPSPHFQTRFYVKDDGLLTKAQRESYHRIIAVHDFIMKKLGYTDDSDGGGGGGVGGGEGEGGSIDNDDRDNNDRGKKFVHLDQLKLLLEQDIEKNGLRVGVDCGRSNVTTKTTTTTVLNSKRGNEHGDNGDRPTKRADKNPHETVM